MKRAGAQHGLSLVEATIILMSLLVLGGVLAPSIKDYIEDAKMVKVKEDCEAIGLSIARLLRDVGPCVKIDGRQPCTMFNRADLLISEGHEVEGYTETARATLSTVTCESVAGAVNYVTEYVPRPAPAGVSWKDATHLGGSTAFYAPPLVTTASLKRMVDTQGLADDIRAVMRDSGIPDAAEGVIATLQTLSTTTTPAGALPACSGVEPPIGSVVECELRAGETLHWMAYRPGAKSGNRAPGRLEYVRWAGKEPVKSFAFRVEADKEVYTFLIPAPCANLSLMSVADIRQREVGGGTTTACSETGTSVGGGASYRSAAWSETVSVNARSEIGWYHTPLWAGLPNGHPNVDYIENHLIRNWPSNAPGLHYAIPGQHPDLLVGPRFNLGWRGPYLSAPIGDDPWGHKYFVNTIFLFAMGNQPHAEGYSTWSSDTVCLSAGPNGWVETPFTSYGYPGTSGYESGYYSTTSTSYYGSFGDDPRRLSSYGYGGRRYVPGPQYPAGTIRSGDDFVYVISGSSR